MAEFVGPRGLPGAKGMTMEQINEIVRGATIKQIRPHSAIDPTHGGECVMIELQGGDRLIFVAVPQSALNVDPAAPTALIQPLLVTRNNTKLKGALV